MCSLEYDFGTCEVPFRYFIKSISVHFKRNFAARLACSAAGLQMLNGCLARYVQHDCAEVLCFCYSAVISERRNVTESGESTSANATSDVGLRD